MTRAGVVLSLVAGAALAVVALERRAESRARLEAEARAAALAARAESLAAGHVADSIAAARAVERWADSLRRLDRGAARWRARADSLGRVIAQTPGPTLPLTVARLAMAAKDTVIAQQARVIATFVLDTADWRRRWTVAEREGATARALLDTALAQLAAANRRAAPRWGCTGGLSGLAGGGVTAAKGVNVGPTLAAGLGITCGVRLR